MHDRRLIDAGVIHGPEQGLIGGWPLARPGGLGAAERGQRITVRIRRNDVRMYVDDGHVRSLALRLYRALSISTNTCSSCGRDGMSFCCRLWVTRGSVLGLFAAMPEAS